MSELLHLLEHIRDHEKDAFDAKDGHYIQMRSRIEALTAERDALVKKLDMLLYAAQTVVTESVLPDGMPVAPSLSAIMKLESAIHFTAVERKGDAPSPKESR